MREGLYPRKNISSLRSQSVDRSEIGLVIEEARCLTQLMSDWKCSQAKERMQSSSKCFSVIS